MVRWLGLAASVWIADRVTKYVVDITMTLGEARPVLPVFSWVRLHNEGAAFSFLDDAGG